MELADAREIVSRIPDGATIAASGFTMSGVCEEIYREIEARFLATSSPRGLTMIHAAGHHDRQGHGLAHFGHPGLLKRIIGTHWGLASEIVSLIQDDEVEAYSFPHGIILQLYRAIAQGQPGFVTKVGLGTFIDPALEGGKMNSRTVESGPDLVHAVEVAGHQLLWFPTIPIDFGFIRATLSDERGNLSTEDEALELEVLPLAQATHNSHGTVISQVRSLVESGSIPPKLVAVPSFLVDVVVVAQNAAETHRQTASEYQNDSYSGRRRFSNHGLGRPRGEAATACELTAREVIGRRALMEIEPGNIINLGIGIPGDTIGTLLSQEDMSAEVDLTIESGVVNGIARGGVDFGVSQNPTAIVGHDRQFDFYDGGGLDVAFMGLGQVDALGNVNVSRLGGRPFGVGGFINITQSTKRVVFMFTFTSGGLVTRVEDGLLSIVSEGKHSKFVEVVDQVSFSGEKALAQGTAVLFVTERAALRLTDAGLELTEVAPGVDLTRDILAQIPFPIKVASALGEYPRRLLDPKRGFARELRTAPEKAAGGKEYRRDARAR